MSGIIETLSNLSVMVIPAGIIYLFIFGGFGDITELLKNSIKQISETLPEDAKEITEDLTDTVINTTGGVVEGAQNTINNFINENITSNIRDVLGLPNPDEDCPDIKNLIERAQKDDKLFNLASTSSGISNATMNMLMSSTCDQLQKREQTLHIDPKIIELRKEGFFANNPGIEPSANIRRNDIIKFNDSIKNLIETEASTLPPNTDFEDELSTFRDLENELLFKKDVDRGYIVGQILNEMNRIDSKIRGSYNNETITKLFIQREIMARTAGIYFKIYEQDITDGPRTDILSFINKRDDNIKKILEDNDVSDTAFIM